MLRIPCENGHVYDCDIFSECPYCKEIREGYTPHF